MSKTWEDIDGWFDKDFQHLYNEIAKTIQTGIIVEVGVWKGKSILYLFSKLKEYKRDNVTLFGVDNFIGDKYVGESNFLEEFCTNVVECGSLYFIVDASNRKTVLGMGSVGNNRLLIVNTPSPEAVEYIPDELSFVFIDALHEYEAVKADIKAWWPKLKIGAILAGHDYNHICGVKPAVDEIFGKKIKLIGTCWCIQKENNGLL